MSPWRAACIQTPSRLACLADGPASARAVVLSNLKRAEQLIVQAMQSDAPPRLVLLPEFAFQGPPHGMASRAWIGHACYPLPGLISDSLAEIAVRHDLYIAAHQFETSSDWPGRYFNTSFLVDPAGQTILRYRRINTAAFLSPHDLMDDYLAAHTPEEIFPVVETALGCLCMIPCGEINVPEVARVMMMQEAEVILHPTNSPPRPTQEAAKISRAAENMMYLVSANVAEGIGFSRDGSTRGGRSHIVDYLGNTLAFEAADHPCSDVSAMIDMTALRAARRTDMGTMNPLLRARWEMYRPFYMKARFYPPNSFLHAPMERAAEAAFALTASIANMERMGVLR